MSSLQALKTAAGTVQRNPILFAVAAAFSLLQLPGLVAQSISPLLGSFVSLAFSGILLFVLPFFLGGVIGMANEAIRSGGRTSLGTLMTEGKSHYVSLLVTYFGLLLLNFVLGFIGFTALAFGGAVVLASGTQPSIGLIAILGVIGVAMALTYLTLIFFVQFFGHAIVIDDLEAVEGVKRSVWCVRHNLVSVFGYTIIVTIGGTVMGVFGALFSLLTMPTFPNAATSPEATSQLLNLPSVGIVGTIGLLLLLVAFSGVFGGFFAAYSTAFYRSIRPSQTG